MSLSNIEIDELKKIIKDALREVLEEIKIDFIISSTPYVSDKEQKEIEEKYGKSPPKRKKIVRRKKVDI